MSKSIVSVFYSAGPDSFFQSRTDFFSRESAEIFIDSRFFTEEGFMFYFMLLNGLFFLREAHRKTLQNIFLQLWSLLWTYQKKSLDTVENKIR
jgi:hypothetical protein